MLIAPPALTPATGLLTTPILAKACSKGSSILATWQRHTVASLMAIYCCMLVGHMSCYSPYTLPLSACRAELLRVAMMQWQNNTVSAAFHCWRDHVVTRTSHSAKASIAALCTANLDNCCNLLHEGARPATGFLPAHEHCSISGS